jgi:hypothetical protein
MRESMRTLWDLLKDSLSTPAVPPAPPPDPGPPSRPTRRPDPAVRRPGNKPSPGPALQRPSPGASMQHRYEQITRQMLDHHEIRVRRWRTSMSGIAWQIRYRDGRIARLIESPKPKGPMSAAIFLHEVGHHAIGFNVYRPRCLEEYHAWAFAMQQMEALGLNITDSVRRRMHSSLRYAVQKAQRRGIRQLPPELLPFTKPWRSPVLATAAPPRSPARARKPASRKARGPRGAGSGPE